MQDALRSEERKRIFFLADTLMIKTAKAWPIRSRRCRRAGASLPQHAH